jgi:hypothetical protein
MGKGKEKGLIELTTSYLLTESRKIEMSASQLQMSESKHDPESNGLKTTIFDQVIIKKENLQTKLADIIQKRLTKRTEQNADSSRSHLVVRLKYLKVIVTYQAFHLWIWRDQSRLDRDKMELQLQKRVLG